MAIQHLDKSFRKYIAELTKSGWEVVGQAKKSFKIRSPKGTLLTMSITPSCPFALKHIQADVRRIEKKEES